MDGFLGFKCGPSCSEKQHNKEIKALIDAIDDLLAYDSKTKKELGATEPVMVDAKMELFGKLDGINGMADGLLGSHRPGLQSSYQPPVVECEQTLQGIGATVDSVRRRTMEAADPQDGGLTEKERDGFQSHRHDLVFTHRFFPEGLD
jgi:hypothetical protein